MYSFPPRRGPARLFRKALRAFALLALSATFLVAMPPAYAQSGKQDPIKEADRLIQAKDFNGAVLFLSDFIKKYPDRFDEAQNRLKVIVAAREAYNKVATELLWVLKNEPENEARKLDLIQKLGDIGGTPNAEMKNFITTVKTASQFVYYAKQLNDIFAVGRAYIDQGRFAEAATNYATGFTLYRQEFDEGPYSDITKKSVATMVDRINAETAYFASSQASLTQAVAAFRAALAAGSPEDTVAAWPAAKAALEDRARRRDAVVQAGRAMALQFEAIKRQDKTSTDSSFLPFATRFTTGNSSATLPEGIVGAMDTQWVGLMGGLETAFTKQLEVLYAQAEASYDKGNWEEATLNFSDTLAYAEPGMAALALWSLVAVTEMLPAVSAYGKSILQAKPLLYERARQLALSAGSEANLARLALAEAGTLASAKGLVASLTSASDLATTLANLAGSRKQVQDIAASITAEAKAATAVGAELARWKDQGMEAADAARTQQSWLARLDQAGAKTMADEVAIVNLALGFEYGRLEAEQRLRSAELDQGTLLLDGVTEANGSGTVAKYPSKGIPAFTAQAQTLSAFKLRLGDYLGRIGRESALVTADTGVQSWAAKVRDLVAKTEALETERVALLARAREQKRQADSAKTEADLRMQQARTALTIEDFETAQSRLDMAKSKYIASLSFEANGDLEASSDAATDKLGKDIVAALDAKVVRDVRALVTTGKTAYFQGTFTKAEDALLQAKARWKTTRGNDPNPEVEYFLRLAQAALSVNTGRAIAPTAPLYAEMSQLLSLARNDYEKGRLNLTLGKRSDATASLASARERINQVKVIFPLNQEAGVLSLRIDQLQDPAAFRQQFASKFAEARAGLKSVTNEIYANLQDLSKIDPNYAGLKDAIYQAEIGLGIRLPPPDPAKARRANDLVAAARTIVDSGDTGRFSIALDQINEAIQLDPNNDRAAAIKDRILTFQGGTAQIVLSSASEEQYRLAVQQFQNGDYLQANAIVARLLQDPKNAKSQKVIDLSKKIKARL